MTALSEELGFGPRDRVVILNCDDLGLCQAANDGVYDALRTGIATSASLMVPCPWGRDAAAGYRGEDIGVHLTLNSEFDTYRWGPITHAPSLLDGDGGFPRTVEDLWDHADLEEVRRECTAQLERAVLWGFDVTHLDSHMGALQLRAEFFDVYLDMAIEHGLPLRMAGVSSQRFVGFPFRDRATEEGVVFPDHFVFVEGGVGSRRSIERVVMDLRPGVTELYVHPARDTAELRAVGPDWPGRVDDLALVTVDSNLRAMLDRAEVHRIGWRPLRSLMRSRLAAG